MSVSKVLRSPIDTWVTEAEPGATRIYSHIIRVNGDTAGSARRRGFIFFPNLALDNKFTVMDARLYMYFEDAIAGGPHTFTLELITARWKAQRATWNEQPAVTVTHSVSVAVTAPVAGQEISFNVTSMLNDVANGSAWYGFRLRVDTVGNKDLSSAQSVKPTKKPRLAVTYYRTPNAPTDLRPAGGYAIASQTPALAWSSEVNQAAFQVQISSDPVAFVANIVHDSGTITDPRQSYRLAETAFSLPVGGALRYWRVRVQNQEGGWSDWSDNVGMYYLSPGVLNIVAPLTGGVIQEVTPPVDWTFTGRTQKAYRVTLFDLGLVSADVGSANWGDNWGRRYGGTGYQEIWSTGWQKSTATRVTIPPGNIKRLDNSYYLFQVDVMDDQQRTSSPGVPMYVSKQAIVTFQEVNTVSPVASLTVTNPEGWYVQLEWTDSVQPDYYGIKVDGEYIHDRETPSKYFASGITYRKKFYGAKPLRASEFEVVRIVKSATVYKHSRYADNPHPSFRFVPLGIWLVDEETDRAVNIGRGEGEADPALQIGESATVYYALGRRDPIRVVDAVRGLEGPVSGLIMGLDDKERFESFKAELPHKTFRLITGDLSIRVLMGEVTEFVVQGNPLRGTSPSPTTKLWKVSLEVFQANDWTFRARY